MSAVPLHARLSPAGRRWIGKHGAIHPTLEPPLLAPHDVDERSTHRPEAGAELAREFLSRELGCSRGQPAVRPLIVGKADADIVVWLCGKRLSRVACSSNFRDKGYVSKDWYFKLARHPFCSTRAKDMGLCPTGWTGEGRHIFNNP